MDSWLLEAKGSRPLSIDPILHWSRGNLLFDSDVKYLTIKKIGPHFSLNKTIEPVWKRLPCGRNLIKCNRLFLLYYYYWLYYRFRWLGHPELRTKPPTELLKSEHSVTLGTRWDHSLLLIWWRSWCSEFWLGERHIKVSVVDIYMDACSRIFYTMRIVGAHRHPLLTKTVWWLISMSLTGGEYQESCLLHIFRHARWALNFENCRLVANCI